MSVQLSAMQRELAACKQNVVDLELHCALLEAQHTQQVRYVCANTRVCVSVCVRYVCAPHSGVHSSKPPQICQ